jgi:hypothetical protein
MHKFQETLTRPIDPRCVKYVIARIKHPVESGTGALRRYDNRLLHCHVSTENFDSGACDFFPRSAKHAGSYPPRIFSNMSSYALGRFATTAGSQK